MSDPPVSTAASATPSTPLVSPELISKIQTDLIDVSYYDDIRFNLKSKSVWKFVGDGSEVLAHVATGAASILAFSTGFFDNYVLSYVAGCLGIVALVLAKFSSYAMGESRERTEQVNKLLASLGMESIPDIVIDSSASLASEQLPTSRLLNSATEGSSNSCDEVTIDLGA